MHRGWVGRWGLFLQMQMQMQMQIQMGRGDGVLSNKRTAGLRLGHAIFLTAVP
jgi:hypothetical protein